MKYYSTNKKAPAVTLKEAVIKGLAPDRGLYMPEKLPLIPKAFFNNMSGMSLQEISYVVANTLFGDDINSKELKDIVYDTLNFDIPLKHVSGNRYVLELFHGPTLAFKDVGARFMARLLGYFNKDDNDKRPVNVLVATSGDTGSAVANGFYGVDGVRVFVLYPKNKVSHIQESQFTTLGKNIFAIEVDGTFDDCQAIVKNAFMDEDLGNHLKLTSANSINIARFMPQMFYYFHAYAQLAKSGNYDLRNVVVSVPSGNFGNLTAGLVAKKMGLPIKRFIAANNSNDVFYHYWKTGEYTPKPSIQTIANAMDVGDPSNFARVLEIYGYSHKMICDDISCVSYSDSQIADTLRSVFQNDKYLLDPHGAVAYRALTEGLGENEVGVSLETAHPAKFKEVVENIIQKDITIPQKLQNYMAGEKDTIQLQPSFDAFKSLLLSL